MADRILDLRYLHYAVVAAEQGSFRRAAQLLGTHQTQIGRRIRALEDRLGTELFERRRSGCRLTPAGEAFLKDASVGMDLVSRAAQSAASNANDQRGRLDIGMMATLSSRCTQRLLRLYTDRYRAIELRVHGGLGSEHLPQLIDGRLDAVIVAGKPSLSGISTRVLWDEHLLLAVPTGHKLARAVDVDWADIAEETFMVTAQGAGPEVHAYLRRRFDELNAEPNVQVHDVAREDLLHLVAMEFGLTLLGESTIGALIPGIEVRAFREPVERIPTTAIWASHNSNPALRKLLNLARDEHPEGEVGSVSQLDS